MAGQIISFLFLDENRIWAKENQNVQNGERFWWGQNSLCTHQFDENYHCLHEETLGAH